MRKVFIMEIYENAVTMLEKHDKVHTGDLLVFKDKAEAIRFGTIVLFSYYHNLGYNDMEDMSEVLDIISKFQATGDAEDVLIIKEVKMIE